MRVKFRRRLRIALSRCLLARRLVISLVGNAFVKIVEKWIFTVPELQKVGRTKEGGWGGEEEEGGTRKKERQEGRSEEASEKNEKIE